MGERSLNEPVSIKLPFPPSTNTLFKTVTLRNGRQLRAPHGRYVKWRDYAKTLIQLARPNRFDKPVMVTLRLFPPDIQARDADNYAKAVLDALAIMKVFPDDNSRHIRELRIIWDNPDDDEPRVVVTVELADMTGVRPPLTADERAELRQIQADGGRRIVGVAYRPSKAIRGLVEKGYLVAEPGLVDGCPQGYTIT